jgi:hypothetical protein
MKYETRPSQWIVAPEGDPMFSERATRITIEDEAAGEFIQVEQEEIGKIQINLDEWPILRAVIDHAIEQCRDDGERQHTANDA